MVRGWVVDRERPRVAILPGEALVISEDFE
jgi:hypothetical protein